MNRLAASQILLLYRELTGEMELISPADMAQIAETPYKKDDEGFYIYKSISERAAMLGYGIMKASPFRKMNAEVAGLSILTLLEINNRRITKREINMSEFLNNLRKKEYETLEEWIDENLIKKGKNVQSKNNPQK